MSKTRNYGIQVWFWPRNCSYIPPEITLGESWAGEPLVPNPTWGPPAADFPMEPGYCNYDQFFNAHEMVFDLTFCVRDCFYLPSDFSRARLRCFLLHRVIGLAMLGPHRAVVSIPARTVSIRRHALVDCRTDQHPFLQLSIITPPLLTRPIGRSTACAYTSPNLE